MTVISWTTWLADRAVISPLLLRQRGSYCSVRKRPS